MNTAEKIVVIGAGYTGMMCALGVAHRTRKLGTTVTLVNPSDRFVERLRMHQIAAGQELAVHPISEVISGTGIEFVRGVASVIDTERRQVRVEAVEAGGAERVLDYDRLVYALGSSTDTSTVPGAAEHAFTLNDPLTAGRFAARLDELAATGGTVTVVGGGLTGIEAAAEIAESHPGLGGVTLISRGEIATMMGERARRHLLRTLDRLGVTVRTGAGVAKVQPNGVELADEAGTVVPSELCLWTAGVRVSPLATEAGIAVDGHGLIRVDATLRSESHPEIHAIGDAAAVRMAWGSVHGTCQSGIPTAGYTAATIARLLRGKPVKHFRFGYFHQPLSLGRKDGVVQFTKADDTPRGGAALTGRRAVIYKELVSGSPLTVYRMSKRMDLNGALSKGGRITRKPVS